MAPTSTADHWHGRWSTHEHEEMGWFQADPQPSLELVLAHTRAGDTVLDVGGGASLLVDRLLDRGRRPTVLDLAEPALAAARRRLDARAEAVTFVRGDVTEVRLPTTFDVWHDRAVLHFLLEDDARDAYVASVRHHLRPGGHVVIGTFAPDGPTTCSGLPVRRQGVTDLHELLGDGFVPVADQPATHVKPDGTDQSFVFVVLRHDG